jgi:toxin ParE1/3/4
MKLRIVPAAEEEFHAAASWYEKQRAGLGFEFLDAVDVAMQEIANAPQRFPPLEFGSTDESVRRLMLERFPYLVIFEILEGEVLVLAVAHTSRKPGYWKDRH